MIVIQTKLFIADNSGALIARCIKILNNKSIGLIGDLILVSLLKINPKKKLIKGSLQKGVIVRSKRKILRNGGYIFVYQNAIVILNNNLLPIATRIFGPILKELRKQRNFSKILSLAKYIV